MGSGKGDQRRNWEGGKTKTKDGKNNPYENLVFHSCVGGFTQKNLTGDTLQRAWCSHKSHRLPNKRLSARYERSPFKLWSQVSSSLAPPLIIHAISIALGDPEILYLQPIYQSRCLPVLQYYGQCTKSVTELIF